MQAEEPQGCLAAIYKFLGIQPKETAEPQAEYPYRQRTFLSPAEISFYHVLRQVTDHTISAKVRLADLIEPEPTQDRKVWRSAFGRISQKHIDFVLCDPDTMKPLLGIELDDKSHAKQKQQERDALVNRALQSADLPLLRVPAQRSYNTAEIAQLLQNIL